jgi:ribosomal protein L7/L12
MIHAVLDEVKKLTTLLDEHMEGTTPATDGEILLLNSLTIKLQEKTSECNMHALTYLYGSHPNSDVWKTLAEANQPIEAIKAARQLHGLGIRDGKDLVDAYREKKYAFAAPASTRLQKHITQECSHENRTGQ